MLIAMISSRQGAWPELGTSAVTICPSIQQPFMPAHVHAVSSSFAWGSSAGIAYKVSYGARGVRRTLQHSWRLHMPIAQTIPLQAESLRSQEAACLLVLVARNNHQCWRLLLSAVFWRSLQAMCHAEAMTMRQIL